MCVRVDRPQAVISNEYMNLAAHERHVAITGFFTLGRPRLFDGFWSGLVDA